MRDVRTAMSIYNCKSIFVMPICKSYTLFGHWNFVMPKIFVARGDGHVVILLIFDRREFFTTLPIPPYLTVLNAKMLSREIDRLVLEF
jgi:hypothetical protein